MKKIVNIVFYALIATRLFAQNNANDPLSQWEKRSLPVNDSIMLKLEQPEREAYKLYAQLFNPDFCLAVVNFDSLTNLKYIVTQKSLEVSVVSDISDNMDYGEIIYQKTIDPFLPFLKDKYKPLHYFEEDYISVISKYIDRIFFGGMGSDDKPTNNDLILIPVWYSESKIGSFENEKGEIVIIPQSKLALYPREKIHVSYGFDRHAGEPIVSLIFNKNYTKVRVCIHWALGNESEYYHVLLAKKRINGQLSNQL